MLSPGASGSRGDAITASTRRSTMSRLPLVRWSPSLNRASGVHGQHGPPHASPPQGHLRAHRLRVWAIMSFHLCEGVLVICFDEMQLAFDTIASCPRRP